MKSLHLLLLALFLPLAAFAAPPLIEVRSAVDVQVDGASAGSIVDAARNLPPARLAELQAAIAKWATRAVSETQQAEQSAARAVLTDALSKQSSTSAAQVADFARRSRKAIAEEKPDELDKILADAERPEKARRKVEMEARKAAVEKELAEFTKEAAAPAK